MRFEDLSIIDPILKALKEKGYEEPTPIQEQSIPLILSKQDVLGCAQTGTGKTAAFAIPTIQLIESYGNTDGRAKIQALIITPTRELALQIDENIRAYSKYTSIKNAVIYGGVKQATQVRQLKQGVHILIATPGRLMDLISQGHISLKDIKLFILDEADRMLDMGFIHDIQKIIKMLPKERQSLFFSATMPDNIVNLSQQILNDPKRVEVARKSSAAETVQQFVYYTNKDTKKNLLVHLIKEKKMEQVLVFSRTKHGANRIARDLEKKGIDASPIHGDRSQNQRQRALKDFKEGRLQVLVATDIAARGIDISKLKFVVNYDIPNEPETYVHRIGRSGRAGEEGVAISISEAEENVYVKDVERLIKKKLILVDDHPFPQTDKPMNNAEKKEFNKEKARKKQAYFEERKKSGGGRAGRGGRR